MRTIIILLLISFIIKPAFAQWTGTLRLVEKYTGSMGISERLVDVSFTDALPTLYRDIDTTDLTFTDDKGTGSVKFHGEQIIEGKLFGTTDCSGSGEAELHEVVIDESDTTYRIHAIGPACTGTSVSALDGSITPYGPEQKDIIITDKRLEANHNILSGTETTISDVIGSGKLTTTITWNLVRSVDAELIVTPSDYNNWLPKPGLDELTKGSVMDISLKVQRRNGQPSALKAKSFELHLSNTSRETGITINFPLSPRANQLPDLRFLPYSVAESVDEDQFITITSNDGSTGKVQIGSYDGGGWTTLTAEATLEGDIHIKGHLLISGGETEIPIPKRNPGTKIASSWLAANGNPGEMDDKDSSAGNTNNGDGLSAYEEYRGVISEGRFKRLDPKKKEVGILASRSDFALFDEGISWFKNASDLKPVRFDFDKDEAPGGRLNMNAKTSHDFDQYAIYLINGGLGRAGTLGMTYSRRRPTIPANVIGVIVDWDYIQTAYQKLVSNTRPETLKFTLQEYLAQTVAHELGHAVNIRHHGSDNPKNMPINPDDRIIYRNGHLMTPHPDSLRNIGDSDGTVEGGNLSCMLNYYPYFSWGHTIGANGVNIFKQEPLLPLGRIFCKSPDGTDINTTKFYFGKAAKGNCLGQILLKN
jgi:hypothetical protein